VQKNTGLAKENRIFGKWTGLFAYADRFLHMRQGDFFRRLKHFVAQNLSNACFDDRYPLSAYDTEIFDSYCNIIAAYRTVADHHRHGASSLLNPEIKSIWEGIHSLIMSRLISEADEAEADDTGINPIIAEKKGIVADTISVSVNEMEDIFAGFWTDKAWEKSRKDIIARLTNMPDFDGLQDILNEAATFLKEFCAPLLYDVYVQSVKSALENLNNFEIRKVAAGYNALLKEEIEILRQIIVVQAMALDKMIWKNETSTEEAAFLNEGLSILRDIYQKEGLAASRINKVFMEAATRNKESLGQSIVDVELCPDFIASLDEVDICPNLPVVYENFKTSVAEKLTAFKEHLHQYLEQAKKEQDAKQTAKALYFAKKNIWQATQMAQECTVCFVNIAEHFKDNEELLSNADDNGIIKGVAETIEIKIDGLKEATIAFDEEMTELIEGYNDTQQAGGDGEVFLAHGEEFVAVGLLETQRGEKRGAKIVKELTDGFFASQKGLEIMEAAQKTQKQKEQKLSQKITAFKRDAVFFEIATFEEIMHYSVSRLRETLDEPVLEFVVEIDKQYKNLEDIITKFGIEKISPKTHEQFNAKEHEVLMAEQKEGFTKGEIIKTINSGYRYNDTIIVRANVIAAR